MTPTERHALAELKAAYRALLADSETREVSTTDENTRRLRLRVLAHVAGVEWAKAERARRGK
jgi:hypothetical protein